jgi:hypothetical protein
MVVGAAAGRLDHRALPFGVVIVIGPLRAGRRGGDGGTIWLPAPALAGRSFFLIGVGPILWTIGTTTLRQMVTPSLLLGRVSAINIATYGSRPLGAAIGAVVGGLYGAETGLVVAAAGFLLQAVVILLSPVRHLARHSELATYA